MSTVAPALKISNVILRVSDVPRSVAFYCDHLGLSLCFANDEFAGLDGGGVQLMLNKPDQAPPGESGGLSSLTEVVFEAADVRSAFRTLQKRGVPFQRELRLLTTDGKRDLLGADFRDPDGHVLSLTGWVSRGAGSK
jgi:catechol 2,3-dioxygenase-like lactoylglutathione lyase family enzyme